MTDNLEPGNMSLAQSTPIEGELIPAGDNSNSKRAHHPIGVVLKDFLSAIDDFRDLVNVALPAFARIKNDEWKEAIAALDAFRVKQLEDGTSEYAAQGVHASRVLLLAIQKADQLKESRLLPSLARSLFIGLFSEYDSFVGALLSATYKCKQELFRGIKREISLAELLEFGDLEAVKADMLEKEIDSFRRESYIDQFAELERKFEFKTLRSFPEWSKFVEMGQRRNVMTHNGGRTSEQYLVVCEREGYKFDPRPEVGKELILSPKYMTEALLVISKIGFMLAHTLWRKLFPDGVKEADNEMNLAIYRLLVSKRWRTASEFGQFGLTDPMCKATQEIDKRVRIVNTAIALKRLNRAPDAIKLLDGEDWSACIREFKLASAVLKEEFITAAQLMKDIGKRGEIIDQMAYHEWPLFDGFRDRSEFQDAYESIYGIAFLQKATDDAQAKSQDLRKTAEDESREPEGATAVDTLSESAPLDLGASDAPKRGENVGI